MEIYFGFSQFPEIIRWPLSPTETPEILMKKGGEMEEREEMDINGYG